MNEKVARMSRSYGAKMMTGGYGGGSMWSMHGGMDENEQGLVRKSVEEPTMYTIGKKGTLNPETKMGKRFITVTKSSLKGGT